MSTDTQIANSTPRRHVDTKPTPGSQPGAARVDRRALFDLGVVLLLLALAAFIHGPVFGGVGGYVAVLGGALLGVGVAVAMARLGVGAIGSALVLIAVYVLFGGALALPETTLYHVVPTLKTLQMLVLGVITSWKDLLTVQPPAGIFTGPAIMPYLSALIASFAAVTIVWRTKRPLTALVPVGVLAGLGILWGSQRAPFALPIGVLMAVISLAWAGSLAARHRREGGSGIVDFQGGGARPARRRRLGAVVMLLVAVLGAAPAAHYAVGDHRTVIRDYVEPPVDLREFHSPVTQFRYLNTTDKDKELFTVDGLAEGDRVRLASLDYYDGTVIQISGNAVGEGFRHVGTEFTDDPVPEGASTQQLTYSILGYTGNWVPGGGRVRGLTYLSARAEDLANVLFYSDKLGTALSTTRLTEGDAYTTTTLVDHAWSDEQLQGRAFAAPVTSSDTGVPTVVADLATELTAEANPGIDQVRMLQRKLHDEGFYSDGTDKLSLPGHRTSRIEQFLSADALIGDDDQYSVAMALMLRALGIPSRVVMGFYPENPTSGTVTITGKDVHMWVEVPFDGAGWVAFDPTPPRDHVPQTQVPKPKPNPRPQVLQPPEPPQDPADLPPDTFEDGEDDEENGNGWLEILMTVLTWSGVGVLVTSPLWLLLLAKARRRRRRRLKGPDEVRTAAAWDEVVDYATDAGLGVPLAATRVNQARTIDARLADRKAMLPEDVGFARWDEERTPVLEMATMLDETIFHEDAAGPEQRDEAWKARNSVLAAIRAKTPMHRRIRAIISTRSLRARRTTLRQRLARRLGTRRARAEREAAPKARRQTSTESVKSSTDGGDE